MTAPIELARRSPLSSAARAPKRLGTLVSFRIAAVAVLAGACDDAPTATEPPPSVVMVTLTAPGVIVRRLDVTLSAAAGVQVDYWNAAGPRLRVVDTSQAVAHTVVLARLRAGTTYQYEARAVRVDGQAGDSVSGAFTTGQLPDYLRALRFEATGTPTEPLTMLAVNLTPESDWRTFVAVDAEGQIVWYYPSVRGEQPNGYTRRANGHHVLMNQYAGLLEVTADLRVVSELRGSAALPVVPHHEVIPTPDNKLLVLSWEPQTFGDTTVQGEAIWEWTPETGAAVRRWRSSSALAWPADRGPPTTVSSAWLHTNSMAYGPRGNLILSNRNTNEVLSLAPNFGAIEWRLGGAHSTFAIPADDRFYGQHTARELANGNVVVFDNGFERPGVRYSRAVELSLDHVAKTARAVWQYRPAVDNYAPILGTAWRTPIGNTVITFGTFGGLVGATGPVQVREVTSTGGEVWRLTSLSGAPYHVYRAVPISDLAGERVATP